MQESRKGKDFGEGKEGYFFKFSLSDRPPFNEEGKLMGCGNALIISDKLIRDIGQGVGFNERDKIIKLFRASLAVIVTGTSSEGQQVNGVKIFDNIMNDLNKAEITSDIYQFANMCRSVVEDNPQAAIIGGFCPKIAGLPDRRHQTAYSEATEAISQGLSEAEVLHAIISPVRDKGNRADYYCLTQKREVAAVITE